MTASRDKDSEPEQDTGRLPIELMLRQTGLELLNQWLSGHAPYPKMSEVIPFRLAEVERGRAVFESLPSESFYNTSGIVHGGYALTLLDTAMGIAVYSTLEAGVGYTTIETKVNFVRPITVESGLLRAIGSIVHTGTKTGTAEGRLVDLNGKIYAHGTTTCFLFSLITP
jgi:uncharacterized protein (TIGR00369 family)